MKKFLIGAFILFQLAYFDVKAETLSYIPNSPTSAVIIIHGYGGNASRMSWMTNSLKHKLPHTAFYYPSAPDPAPTGGYQWFIIPVLGEEIKEKKIYDKMMTDALKNVFKLHNLVDDIHHTLNIPYQNIHAAGFSQGGLMALLTILTSPHQMGKAISFSGVPLLFTPDFSKDEISNSSPVLLMQGDQDRIVPENSMEMSSQTLKSLNIPIIMHTINGLPHSINHQEVEYMINFIKD